MTYFHTGIRTIIGAGLFHCPVRDGKEWGQTAIVIRQNCCVCLEFIECLKSNGIHRVKSNFDCVT